jgi:hypothetical protein
VHGDTLIYPSFTFKIPLGPNSTTQSVQEVSQFFRVTTIEPLPNGENYFAVANQPLIINGTSYPHPQAYFTDFNDETALITISQFTQR